jgi:prepilin-type N-terminal cleavage/methylation domain-containing protein
MRNRKRGFTLIEMSVVIAVLALLATAVVPVLAAFKKGQVDRSFLSQLRSIGGEAKEKAISLANPVDLEFDDSSNTIKIHTTNTDGSDKSLETLQLPEGYAAQRFQLAGKESDASQWKLGFYPDGSCDGGGIQVTHGNDTVSLFFDALTSKATMTNSSLPDPSTLQWAAGDYVHRSQ